MILVTVDTSPESEAAISTAVDLARRFGERLRILLVVESSLRHEFDQRARATGSTVDGVAQGYLANLAETVRASGFDDFDVEFRHSSDAGTGIIEAADDPDVVLLVMATHGRSGFSRLLAGSVTEQIIRASPVPVVAVPVHTP